MDSHPHKEFRPPNKIAVRSILSICFISLCCLPLSAATNEWQRADEGSFTFDAPKLLEKQVVQCFDSRCGTYFSPHMQLNFDEVSLSYSKKEAKAVHNEFKRGYRRQKGAPTGPDFFLKLGERYAKVKVSSDAVEFFCPDPRGNYLSIWIFYQDEKETDTALRIIKSVQIP